MNKSPRIINEILHSQVWQCGSDKERLVCQQHWSTHVSGNSTATHAISSNFFADLDSDLSVSVKVLIVGRGWILAWFQWQNTFQKPLATLISDDGVR